MCGVGVDRSVLKPFMLLWGNALAACVLCCDGKAVNQNVFMFLSVEGFKCFILMGKIEKKALIAF